MVERQAGRLVFAIPGSLDSATGGYIYDARVIDGLLRRGHAIEVLSLGPGFPDPDDKQRAFAERRLLQAAGDASAIIVDGLALGVLPEAARRVAERTRLIALVHHPLGYEYGLPPMVAVSLVESERQALASAGDVIVTSETTAGLLEAAYGVERGRSSVARPGVEPVTLSASERSGRPRPLRLLSVAALSPRKGFDLLIAALASINNRDFMLTIAGDESRSPATGALLRADIAAAGLEARIRIAGLVSEAELEQLYAEADLFVLASHYEGYGMAYAEALAHGLPIIGTTGGAIPEVVPEAAGILVPSGDVGALAEALSRLIEDDAMRARKAEAARAAARSLPRWSETIDVFERVLNEKSGR